MQSISSLTTPNNQLKKTFANSLYKPKQWVYDDNIKPWRVKMKEQITVTANEIVALKECLNYDDRSAQLADNYSNGGVDEFMKALGWNAKQVGGLISSLTEKGLVYHETAEERWEEGGFGQKRSDFYDICWLTELGVNTIFDIIESE